MKPSLKVFFTVTACLHVFTPAVQAELPVGYWSAEQSQELLNKTRRIELAPDLSGLSDAERRALPFLLQAGRLFHILYEQQLHAEAASARATLEALHEQRGQSAETGRLLDLYYLSKGPILTNLDNERVTFLPVTKPHPGKNVYPAGLTQTELNNYIAAHPQQASQLLATRTVVRRASEENLSADRAVLEQHPELKALHHEVAAMLNELDADSRVLYAIPYAIAYAAPLAEVRQQLDAAAAILADTSPDFAAYLRNRSRDLLSSDYEAGDASWVSGSFDNLNAQLGSYETYNDSLQGVKAFFSGSILVRDAEKSRLLQEAVSGLQAIEDELPYDSKRQIRANIPVGAYNIIADFGQARGTNTATILPNDADHTRKYGRTILVRYNILANPVLFETRQQQFAAVLAPDYADDLTLDGGFERTLWHEIGHYLGVSKTLDGKHLDEALGEYSDLLEEMKADLVSLFAAQRLADNGYHDAAALRAHYADGIRRTLQQQRPRPEQPYQNMQLMQFNFFMESGLIEADGESGLLAINYDRYNDVVTDLLSQVLSIQHSGDRKQAEAFIGRWNYWEELLHGRMAEQIRASTPYRRTLVRYAALTQATVNP